MALIKLQRIELNQQGELVEINDRVIKTAISSHPKLSYDGNPVQREVEFVSFLRYEPRAGFITILLQLSNKINGDTKKINIEYSLSNSIFLNVANAAIAVNQNGLITDENDLLAENTYMGELDYWFSLMADQPLPDRTLIIQAIENLDTNAYFDKYI